MRVQGSGELVRVDESEADDGDGVDSRWRDGGCVPRHPGVLRGVGAAAPAREGEPQGGGARDDAAGGGTERGALCARGGGRALYALAASALPRTGLHRDALVALPVHRLVLYRISEMR